MNAGREKCLEEGGCRVCGATAVEAAHLWPKSLGAKGYEWADLIVPLCKRHHEQFDAHKLELLPYLDRAEEAALVSEAGIARAYARVTVET